MIPNEKIEQYCEQMKTEKSIHAANEELKAELKQSLIDAGETEAKFGKYTIQLEIRDNSSVDAAKMLMILKEYWEKEKGDEKCPFIRTIEVLDENELEAFLYREKLPDDVITALDGCRTKGEIKALKYKIAKKEK